QQAHRREPLYRETHRFFQPIIVELVVDRVAEAVAEIHPAGREDVADVEEEPHPRGIPELLRRRHDQLELVREQQVAAVRTTEVVARPEIALLVAAHRPRSAGVTVAERRQSRRLAERIAVRELAIDLEDPSPPERHELREIEGSGVILDLAARNRGVEPRSNALPRGRENRSVARIVGPAGGDLERTHVRAEGVLADDERVAVLPYPLLRLIGAEESGDELGVLVDESEVQVLHLADRVLPSEPAAQRLRREMRRVRRELCDVLVGELDRPRQLVDRAVVIGELEIVNLLILARARRQRDAVARAREVRVDDLAAEDHALRLGVTELSA